MSSTRKSLAVVSVGALALAAALTAQGGAVAATDAAHTTSAGAAATSSTTASQALAAIKKNMTSANQVNSKPHINTMTRAQNVNVYQVATGVYAYTSSLAVDTDGSDPDPDPDHQGQTTFTDSNGKYLGSHHVPFYVLGDDCWDRKSPCPHFFYKDHNIHGRQFALMFYNGRVIGSVFGDTQTANNQTTSDNDSRELGEASVKAAASLGINSSGTSGGVNNGVTVAIFSGSSWVVNGTNSTLNDNAQALVQKAMDTFGSGPSTSPSPNPSPTPSQSPPPGGTVLLSQGKPCLASSEGGSGYVCRNAFDGLTTTRWASVSNVDPQWLRVDLGSVQALNNVKLIWDLSCAPTYQIQLSNDGTTFTTAFSTTTGAGGTEVIPLAGKSARYVRMLGQSRCRTTMGYSLQEMQVYGGGTSPSPSPTTQPSTSPSPTTPPSSTIVNGGFETGDFTGWTRTGTTSISTTAHSGTHSVMLGSTSQTNGDSKVAQTFTAPSGATTLSFYYRLTCPDDLAYDWATATLKDNTTGVTTTPLGKVCSNTGTWNRVATGVTAGHSYTLTLVSHDENTPGDATSTKYDDITVS